MLTLKILAAIYIPSTLIFFWGLATAAPDPYDEGYTEEGGSRGTRENTDEYATI